MKKSTKPAPVTTATVIYDDPFNALLDTELLIYEEEMEKREKVQLNLVPQACGFSSSGHANRKCNVEYDIPPTAQRSMK
eukprot:13137570-Ditylum_brightwellii.AAC.1